MGPLRDLLSHRPIRKQAPARSEESYLETIGVAVIVRDFHGRQHVHNRTELQSPPRTGRRADEAAHGFPEQALRLRPLPVSGRKIPRDGGIILAVGKSREEIEAIAAQDPFCQKGVADFRVIEFRVSQRAEDVEKRISEKG